MLWQSSHWRVVTKWFPGLPVAVVTDNDNDYLKNIKNKYAEFNGVATINIFADKRDELNTLEPQFVDANKHQLKKLCEVIGIDFKKCNTEELISQKMQKMKTTWALKVFTSNIDLEFPDYINRLIIWANE